MFLSRPDSKRQVDTVLKPKSETFRALLASTHYCTFHVVLFIIVILSQPHKRVARLFLLLIKLEVKAHTGAFNFPLSMLDLLPVRVLPM